MTEDYQLKIVSDKTKLPLRNEGKLTFTEDGLKKQILTIPAM